MATESFEQIREYVEEGYSPKRPKTGDRYPPNNRRLDLRRGEIVKETYVTEETWESLKEADWFRVW